MECLFLKSVFNYEPLLLILNDQSKDIVAVNSGCIVASRGAEALEASNYTANSPSMYTSVRLRSTGNGSEGLTQRRDRDTCIHTLSQTAQRRNRIID